METFRDNDIITSYEDLNEKYCPLGFQYKKTDDYVIYFNLKFDDYTSFPKVFECIRIDRDLHVQLQFNGNPVPLHCHPGLFKEQMRNSKDLVC